MCSAKGVGECAVDERNDLLKILGCMDTDVCTGYCDLVKKES